MQTTNMYHLGICVDSFILLCPRPRSLLSEFYFTRNVAAMTSYLLVAEK